MSTANRDKRNIMILSRTMILDFTPRFAFMTGPWNYSYKALLKTGKWVIAIPAVEISKTVVPIGACSWTEVNKFEKFKLTLFKAE